MPTTSGSHGLEMARVAGEGEAHRAAARRLVAALGAEVVLHVARALGRVGVELALELPEDLPVGLADHVGEHVQAAAVRHADDAPPRRRRRRRGRAARRASGSGSRRPRGRSACGRRTWCGGRSRTPPPRSAARGCAACARCRTAVCSRSTLLLDPRLLVGILDVHVLEADGAGVGVAQRCAGCRAAASSARPPIPAQGNSRSRSQIVRPWWTGSSSAWVFGSFSPSGSRFAIRWPRTR